MSLARFSVIVAVDSNGGISKEGKLPWKSSTDMIRFRDITTGDGNNCVIMGRKTFESIPENFRPLAKRTNIVITTSETENTNDNYFTVNSLKKALEVASTHKYEKTFIIGGESVYNQAMNNYLYLCDSVYLTKFKIDYSCDQFFPTELVSGKYPLNGHLVTSEYTFYNIDTRGCTHQETAYLDLLQKLIETGEICKNERTGVGTRRLTSQTLRFNMLDGTFPLLTTKRVSFKNILQELLFFIRGDTSSKILEEKGVNIWKGNTTEEFLKERGLYNYEEGQTGPIYGWQWRQWNKPYDPAFAEDGKEEEDEHDVQYIDQLANVVNSIHKEPHSRRHIVSAWNPEQLDDMCLPPCHLLYQFLVSGDGRYLDVVVTQRSGDVFLGIPYNIASYSILLNMVAVLTSLTPREVIINIGDCHIYENHIPQATKQIQRTPLPFPKLNIRRKMQLKTIDDFDDGNVELQNYESWPILSAKMAV